MNGQAEDSVQKFAFVLIPRFNMTALATTLEPLRIANYLSARTLYQWRFLSVDGGTVTASNAMTLDSEAFGGTDDRWNAIFVCGSWDSEHYENAKLFAWLRRLLLPRALDFPADDMGGCKGGRFRWERPAREPSVD